MYLFLLLLLPASLLCYLFVTKEKKLIVSIFTGLICAVVVVACRFFFSYEHRLISYSFAENFVYSLIKQNFLPLVVMFGVFTLVSKDTIEDKFKNFFPLIISFFTVYLPYCVMSSSEVYYQGYDIFLKPFIYFSMICQIAVSLQYTLKFIQQKKIIFVILNILLILIYAVYPAVSDSLYAIDYNFVIVLIIGIIYSILPFGHIAVAFYNYQKD